ncbi:hypothetical protein CRE_05457 [Caenorhabditis remanei]|uniref:Uncharacterized protein n=3 Tax=Caenorhabditis TaxID=6237 RepID=E3M0M3_CAERE|nr:hypothetical protein CRE_05457 [Caenorhabditis remanei]
MFQNIAVFVSCFAIAASGYNVRPSTKNTVQDAHDQLTKSIRCWEPAEQGAPSQGGYTLSEPIYELCSYMPAAKGYDKFYVNGVDMESDDYTHILALFGAPHHGYAVLNVCLQEAFQFHAAGHPSQTSLRCLCKRDGCNLPKDFTTFLDFNKLPMPETFF